MSAADVSTVNTNALKIPQANGVNAVFTNQSNNITRKKLGTGLFWQYKLSNVSRND